MTRKGWCIIKHVISQSGIANGYNKFGPAGVLN